MRCFISRAALLVKVTARICEGKARPVARMWAMRVVSTRVLPVPAPASTRTGPSVVSTASASVRGSGRRDSRARCLAAAGSHGARGNAADGAAGRALRFIEKGHVFGKAGHLPPNVVIRAGKARSVYVLFRVKVPDIRGSGLAVTEGDEKSMAEGARLVRHHGAEGDLHLVVIAADRRVRPGRSA